MASCLRLRQCWLPPCPAALRSHLQLAPSMRASAPRNSKQCGCHAYISSASLTLGPCHHRSLAPQQCRAASGRSTLQSPRCALQIRACAIECAAVAMHGLGIAPRSATCGARVCSALCWGASVLQTLLCCACCSQAYQYCPSRHCVQALAPCTRPTRCLVCVPRSLVHRTCSRCTALLPPATNAKQAHLYSLHACRVGVGVVVLRNYEHAFSAEVLLIRRAKKPSEGLLCFPGGRLEWGVRCLEGCLLQPARSVRARLLAAARSGNLRCPSLFNAVEWPSCSL